MNGCPFHLSGLHGSQGITEEDRVYRGSRYSDIKEALFENPYQQTFGTEGSEPFPVYQSTTGGAFAGFLPGGKRDQLLSAARRAVASRADLRWGEDRCGYRRILHPNGICLLGHWEITEANPYSGYFRPGSKGLMISRLSPHGTAVHRGKSRSFGLIGKIFPTIDEQDPESYVPANFFTQQDIGGARVDYLNDAEYQNAPDVSFWRRGLQIPVLLRSGLVFNKANKVADVRQLHEIAELGKPSGEPTNAPDHMVLKMTSGQPRIDGDGIDFREEVYSMVYDKGATAPARTISFDIAVSDEARVKGTGPFKRVSVRNPQFIGRMVFHDVVASYNGDHVIHFHHPDWRDDRNDPATAVPGGG